MSQDNSGFRALLASGKVYDSFQELLGSNNVYRTYATEYLNVKAGDRVLDIGCGTGRLIEFLPEDVDYYGCDTSERYINAAYRRYSHRGRWLHIDSNDLGCSKLAEQRYDLVMANGLLHHLDDDEVLTLVRYAKGLLMPNGTFTTIDICLTGKNAPGNILASLDRGKNVRDIEGYTSLISREFSSVTGEVRGDLTRLPYTHAIVSARC